MELGLPVDKYVLVYIGMFIQQARDPQVTKLRIITLALANLAELSSLNSSRCYAFYDIRTKSEFSLFVALFPFVNYLVLHHWLQLELASGIHSFLPFLQNLLYIAYKS